jgi:DNA polymerase III sliding clamp (beta) subunit (PCNA family)
MIEVLKTVMAAVSTKDMVPVFTHFCLYSGRVQGCNGVVYIDAPFPHDIAECTVPANRFLKAVEACDDDPTFGVTDGGKLSVKRGRFRAYLPILPFADFPRATLDGSSVPVPPDLVQVLTRLKPFISEDASRPWSLSILLREGFAYATNNIIVMRTPIDWQGPEVTLPVQLVDRVLEVGEVPNECHIGPQHICFSWGDTWMRSALTLHPWPGVETMCEKEATEVVPQELKDAVTKIKAFCVNEKFPVIRLSDVVQTDDGEHGASFEGFDLPEGAYHADQLLKVLTVATHIDFSAYPAPCAVTGDKLQGLIVGLKKT